MGPGRKSTHPVLHQRAAPRALPDEAGKHVGDGLAPLGPLRRRRRRRRRRLRQARDDAGQDVLRARHAVERGDGGAGPLRRRGPVRARGAEEGRVVELDLGRVHLRDQEVRGAGVVGVALFLLVKWEFKEMDGRAGGWTGTNLVIVSWMLARSRR